MAEIPRYLRAVEAVEIVSVVDNCIESRSTARRADVQSLYEWAPDPENVRSPHAEHGLCCLVRIFSDFGKREILFDAASEAGSVAENAARMHLDLSGVEAIALSHQHWDHTGGLVSVLEALHADSLPVVLHPDAFQVRGWRDPDDPEAEMSTDPDTLSRQAIEAAGGYVVEAGGPYLLCEDSVLVTGQVPRLTDFEPGLPSEHVLEGGKWRPAPLVPDDRSLVVHVRGKGLVILAGCAHSGIVNTVRYARELTGIDRVAAILGGFHLAGKYFEPHIPDTVAALDEFEPRLLVPSHCTGWPGRFALALAFPEVFVPNSVGNLYRIAAD